MPKLTWGWTGKEATVEDVCSQVGPGWSNIIRELVIDLCCFGWNGEIGQVKEKFGTLRFYIGSVESSAYEKIYERIEQAELESAKTCELCGKAGKIRNERSWVKTLCDECWDEDVKIREGEAS